MRTKDPTGEPAAMMRAIRRVLARRRGRLARTAGGLAAVGLIAFILAKSWLRWMDPQIDLGLQLYLPWRVTVGEHLERDLVHPYGPLSTYFNAGLFSVFGMSVRTLVVANLAIYAAIVGLLAWILRQGFGFVGAALATLVGIAVFGFGNYSGVANYTYAAPYTHEATHGMLLLLGLLVLLLRDAARARPTAWVAGGVFGLVLLTKVEVAFAAGLVVAAAGMFRLAGEGWRPALRWFGSLALSALGVLTLTWLLLAWATDSATAARVTVGGFLAPLLYPAHSIEPHNAAIMGLDHPWANLQWLLRVGALAVAYVLLLTAILRWAANRAGSRAKAALALALTAAVLLAAWPFLRDSSIRAGRALPLLLLGAAPLVWRRAADEFRERRRLGRRTLAQALLGVAALGLMARVILSPKVYHYGFYLTMLAGVWVTAFLATEWPQWSLRRSRWRLALGAALALSIGIVATNLLAGSLRNYALKSYPVGEGADRIYGLDPKLLDAHALIENARRYLVAHTAPDATVLVMPEGISLNYWARRKTPLRICDTLTPHLKLYGPSLLGDLQARPPDYVVLMSRMAADVFPTFGSTPEAGQDLVPWLAANYLVVASAGGDPLARFRGKDFGIRILKRKPAS